MTSRRYTGQRMEGIGLYDYGARWFDASLGRFVQADTIVPNPGDPQAWDRYAAMANNPIRFIDPTGHRECESSTSDQQCGFMRPHSVAVAQRLLKPYRVTLVGDWIADDAYSAYEGVYQISQRASNITGQDPISSFKSIYHGMEFVQVDYKCLEGCWGRSISASEVRFYSPAKGKLDPRLVVHELGHSFNAAMVNNIGEDWSPYSVLDKTVTNDPTFPRRSDLNNGYAGPFPKWQQSSENTVGEEFADMFIGWVFDKWGRGTPGSLRADWMRWNMQWIIMTNFLTP
jgi:RHS repeat-associated protein